MSFDFGSCAHIHTKWERNSQRKSIWVTNYLSLIRVTLNVISSIFCQLTKCPDIWDQLKESEFVESNLKGLNLTEKALIWGRIKGYGVH
jgi:hypothetical protein